jgi:translation initiation factor 4E
MEVKIGRKDLIPAQPVNEEVYSDEESEEKESDDDQLTKLEYEFTFWFSYFREMKNKQVEDYENFIKKIGEFDSAEEFWGYYQHIRRPDSLPKSCEVFLFKSGIRPLWEDPANKGGGRFVLHIKKIFANKTWEDMLIAVVCSTKDESEINGVVINVRSWEILLSIWMGKIDEEKCEKYRAWIRKSLGMTENIKIEYKEHPNPEEVKNKVPPHHQESQSKNADTSEKEVTKPKAEPVPEQEPEKVEEEVEDEDDGWVAVKPKNKKH